MIPRYTNYFMASRKDNEVTLSFHHVYNRTEVSIEDSATGKVVAPTEQLTSDTVSSLVMSVADAQALRLLLNNMLDNKSIIK